MCSDGQKLRTWHGGQPPRSAVLRPKGEHGMSISDDVLNAHAFWHSVHLEMSAGLWQDLLGLFSLFLCFFCPLSLNAVSNLECVLSQVSSCISAHNKLATHTLSKKEKKSTNYENMPQWHVLTAAQTSCWAFLCRVEAFRESSPGGAEAALSRSAGYWSPQSSISQLVTSIYLFPFQLTWRPFRFHCKGHKSCGYVM